MPEWVVPYAIAVGFAMVVGIAEVVSTFSESPREAMLTGWAWGLVLLNGIAAALVLALVLLSPTARANSVLTALAVGVGLPTLIRTKFTVAKQFTGGEGGDLSLNLGWLYEQFQSLCKTQIDLRLMTFRHQLVQRLITRYPDEKTLFQLAQHTVLTRAGLTEEEREQRNTYLEETFARLPPETARVALALFILDTGGREYLEMLSAAPEQPSPQQLREALLAKFSDLASLTNVVRQAIADAPALSKEEREQRSKYLDTLLASSAADEQKRAALALLLLDVRGREYVEALLKG